MLLFINGTDVYFAGQHEFQYISCYCLSDRPPERSAVFLISIHLMLLFIFTAPGWLKSGKYISIHLMLLFILTQNLKLTNLRHFNTSHVTVYRSDWCSGSYSCIFQYISCYCLSLVRRHLKQQQIYFNTSHVTVYQWTEKKRKYLYKFQYISCYCLSICYKEIFGGIEKFQYISCYCLSIIPSGISVPTNEFQYISCYCLSCAPYLSSR